ncbi:hypothetical protein B0J17DRAFT_631706 [Rhizoctonia solani]|nr:hypothetical protein B0J17DRAFT_631706 [Rhizoctonia solani]
MAAPLLPPPALQEPVATPAAEWAQETVNAISPNAPTGVVTDASGNPTTDHSKSALSGEPGFGMNAVKTAAQLDAQRSAVQPPATSAPITRDERALANERPRTEPAPKVYTDAQGNPTTNPHANALTNVPGTSASKVYTDAQGNPTTNPHASALSNAPGTGAPLPSATNKSLPPTPAPQLPGGWIRGPESRQNSVIIPETSLYEDVSEALGTVGKAAFSALPASVVGSLSNNEANGQAPATSAESKPSPPPRSASPGLLSRAQGMITGLLDLRKSKSHVLARPASPAAKLPAPDAPTTTSGDAALVGGGAVANTTNKLGESIASPETRLPASDTPTTSGGAALVGGGAVANTANRLGERIAAGRDLGGHNPQGVKETEQAKLEREGAGNVISPESANTAARFLDADVPTPDPTKPPRDPGIAGSVFPALPDEGKKNKGSKLGSTLSPDLDVQEAARRSNQDFTVPIGSQDAKSQTVSESDRPQPTVTKVSDSGVKGMLMDVKDMVSAPFAGSRASQELARPSDAGSPHSPSKSFSPAELATGANPEGIRTTANPHTAHTGLPPTKGEASEKYVGGTAVIQSPVTAKSTTDRNALSGHKDTPAVHGDATPSAHKDTTPGAHKESTPIPVHKESTSSSQNEPTTTEDGVPLQGVSSHTGGVIYAGEGGALTQRSNPAVNSTSPPGSPNKGVSRLWSRSRRSVDEGTVGSKSNRSRFNEEPSTGSESASSPTSPSSSRFKVPLKDKIKGELKIISGKVSRNEAKVEQGVALKTGQDPTSPTVHKH